MPLPWKGFAMPKIPPTPKTFGGRSFDTYETLPADDKPAPEFIPTIVTAALIDPAESAADRPDKKES